MGTTKTTPDGMESPLLKCLRTPIIMTKRLLFTIALSTALFFGLTEPSFAVNIQYDFHYGINSNTIGQTYANQTTGQPWYIWWEETIEPGGSNCEISVYSGAFPSTTSIGDTFTPQQCQDTGSAGINGNTSLENYLVGKPQGVYNVQLIASSTPTDTRYQDIAWTGTGYFDAEETRIISVVPVRNSTVSTSTTISALVYVAPEDYEDGMVVNFSFTNQTLTYVGGSVLQAYEAAFTTGGIDLPVLSSGTTQVSTSTVFGYMGITTGIIAIRTESFLSGLPLLGTYFQPNSIVSTTTRFTVTAMTGLDLALASSSLSLADYLLTGTTTQPILNCNFGSSFTLEACLVSLIIPSSEVLKEDIQQASDLVLRSWPIGYITRAVEIFVSEATSTLPTISIEFPGETALAGEEWTIDPWGGYASVYATLESSGDNPQNVWEILDIVWNTVIYLLLFGMIVHDITGLHKHTKHH